jgi:hypothetical protein
VELTVSDGVLTSRPSAAERRSGRRRLPAPGDPHPGTNARRGQEDRYQQVLTG